MRAPLLAAGLMMISAPLFAGDTCTATGGATVPPIVELYTSEGCDSCPPADRWLGTLKELAARGVVLPLAFHVDYWDYLGWKDPFAEAAFGPRQRERAGEAGAKVVYTPQVLYDNREFQDWRKTAATKLPLQAAMPARAELRVNVANDGQILKLDVAGSAKAGTRAANAYIALYENGLASDVKAGENRGVMLHHDFVVRRWLGPFPFNSNVLALTQSITPAKDMKLDRSGIAVIASDDNGAVIQAVSLSLRNCAG
jgi:hypothetical protein